MLTKQSIIRKTIEVGGSTMISRVLGLIREILMANYLGAGAIADAFVTAYKIPNSLRKIFAEGALSVSFIPTFVKIAKKDGKQEVNRLMSLALLLFEGVLLIFCLLVIWKADLVIRLIAPGWFESEVHEVSTLGIPYLDNFYTYLLSFFHASKPIEQVAYSVTFLRILMGLILFLSTSALLAGALQAVNHFFVAAFSQVLLNIVFITGLASCIFFKLPPNILCFFILFGGLLQLILHVVVYFNYGFGFGKITPKTWQYFKEVWKKFLPCLFSMSVIEIYLFIDTSLSSYLPTGSIALVYYANRFMQIPLGVFATAFSTILLPHFSRVGQYAPKRLGFYLLESAKLIFFIVVPISLLMGFASEKIFSILFFSKKFSPEYIYQASIVLIMFLGGLFFFSLNKILLNLYYALHETKIPMYISIVATFANFILSYSLMTFWGVYGIALATTFSGILQTILFIVFLRIHFKFTFYAKAFAEFLGRFSLQLGCFLIFFVSSYWAISYFIDTLAVAPFFMYNVGFWIWFLPLNGVFFYLMFKTRKFFGIHLYFLD